MFKSKTSITYATMFANCATSDNTEKIKELIKKWDTTKPRTNFNSLSK